MRNIGQLLAEFFQALAFLGDDVGGGAVDEGGVGKLGFLASNLLDDIRLNLLVTRNLGGDVNEFPEIDADCHAVNAYLSRHGWRRKLFAKSRAGGSSQRFEERGHRHKQLLRGYIATDREGDLLFRRKVLPRANFTQCTEGRNEACELLFDDLVDVSRVGFGPSRTNQPLLRFSCAAEGADITKTSELLPDRFGDKRRHRMQ